MENKNEEQYLDNLHEASRMYYVAIWAIPGIFLGVQGLVLQVLNFNEFISFKNLLVLFFDFIFSCIFWSQFEKSHVWQLLIQGKIDGIENSNNSGDERIPLYSMKYSDFKSEIAKWELKDSERYLPCHSRIAVQVRVSRMLSYTMIFIMFLLFGSSVFLFLKLFIL
ncbi:hypothetical protein A3A03_03940 [Candidatus Nomurabacteria bacterium RIFCSPLOWO2_01_FULL_40_18]|uniref:Uncharacterized protein n=1 Tax=Candidatus Nomurabacteria bacterium RIFCSPLOWO2_01_FULL_40_18 TaxID=1801773 RepID=A0A1F6XJV9_9BACT|nr:MAG: hypothetical protein A3A03_03940 [Candidatus Nomurabacteria bacterium RIFCSPLOWO2_01_FULL_40_18]